MRGKDTFLMRGLSAGFCIVALLISAIIAGGAEKTEEKKPEQQTVYCADVVGRRKPDEGSYCRNRDDSLWQNTEPFVFGDLNADGYLDLIVGENKSGGYCILTTYLWSGSQHKFVRGPEKLNGYNYDAVVVDEDSRRIQVGKGKNGGYENNTYQWSNETDCELVKAFYETRTEDGVSVHIVCFRDGEEQVLMDCAYDTCQFPYYFERYFYNSGDIFSEFYRDDFVWEKTIHVEELNQTYTLYYAQEVQYDNENAADVTGYEGHLWVTDEETRIVKRLFWQSETPYIKITWEEQSEKQEDAADAAEMVDRTREATLFIQYADGSDRICTLSEILQDPAEAVYEKSMQIDFGVKEYPINTEKNNAAADKIYRDAYYRALSGLDKVRTSDGEEVYLKGYWHYQGDSLMEMEDDTFLKNLIENSKFYYMDFDGDGLPELVMDIIGDGLHILKYLPDEKLVEIFFGYERMPYFHLLGSGQLYYRNPTLTNKSIWEYDIVDADGQDSLVIYFEEDYDYKPHKDGDSWDAAYWVYLDEELGMVQVDEKRYQEMAGDFFNAVEHAVTAMTFEEVFGEGF